jgi:polyhydroxybutyrate depolymerase
VIRTLFALSAMLLAFVWACGGSGGSATGTPTAAPGLTATTEAGCPQALAHAAGNSNQTLSSGGLERTYILHVPVGYDGSKRTPLVLSFHGFSLNASFFAPYAGFDAIADRSGFIVVTPDAAGSPAVWNAGGTVVTADDIAFVRDLLARLDDELCIDPDRVYADGYSNGGGMALRLACEMPERIAAVGVVAATYENCRGPVPLIAFHGTADQMEPFQGGEEPPGNIFRRCGGRRSQSGAALGCDGLCADLRVRAEAEVDVPAAHRACRTCCCTPCSAAHTWPGATASEHHRMDDEQVNARAN